MNPSYVAIEIREADEPETPPLCVHARLDPTTPTLLLPSWIAAKWGLDPELELWVPGHDTPMRLPCVPRIHVRFGDRECVVDALFWGNEVVLGAEALAAMDHRMALM